MSVGPQPYIAISAHPHGSFGWAMDQVRAGKEVRRKWWPIEVRAWVEWQGYGETRTPVTKTETMIWHIYDAGYDDVGRFCQGFNSGIVGADNDSWGHLGMDSGGYRPNVDDKIALDWMFVENVTPDMVDHCNAHRLERIPNPVMAEDRAEMFRREKRDTWIGISALVAFLVMAGIWWAK